MESGPRDLTGRAIDLLAPLGKGQRGLIIAPPKAGKTQILQRLARASNLGERGVGRSLSGGLDASALRMPRQFLGDARTIEGGGSLTILATVLVETGSRLDDVVFEEFKGTGNWEVRLSRRVAERRLYPAIDVAASGTRREGLLMSAEELEGANRLRRQLIDMGREPEVQTERLLELLHATPSNEVLLQKLARR